MDTLEYTPSQHDRDPRPISTNELAQLRGEGGPQAKNILDATAAVNAVYGEPEALATAEFTATAETATNPEANYIEFVVSAGNNLLRLRAEAQQNGLTVRD